MVAIYADPDSNAMDISTLDAIANLNKTNSNVTSSVVIEKTEVEVKHHGRPADSNTNQTVSTNENDEVERYTHLCILILKETTATNDHLIAYPSRRLRLSRSYPLPSSTRTCSTASTSSTICPSPNPAPALRRDVEHKQVV